MRAVDADSYDPVARTFARLSRQYTTPLAGHLVALAGVGPADRVLDVGTGTGIVALQIARLLGPSGYVAGIDTASGMLEEARAAAGEESHVEFREADAAHLPFEGASFDLALSLFALTHVADPAAALREVHRVLRPGGRLALGVGGAPPTFSAAGVGDAGRGLRRRLATWRGRCLVAPRFIESALARRAAFVPHPPALPAPRLRDLARDAGFVDVRLSWQGGEVPVATPEEFWELQSIFSTPARLWLADALPAEGAALQRDVTDAGARVLARGGRLLYLYGACLLEARRP
jgi:SAM-dependent methyltransferase